MCRLFGFKSVIHSQVHSSLMHADNALLNQSANHPDGWGVAFYKEGIPHLIKSTDRALDDKIFKKVSGIVSSHSVIAHLRKATQGQLSILNSHPFQYGQWVFAHNGNLKNFSSYREDIINLIDSELRPYIFGSTDSEIIFALILSEMKKRFSLKRIDIRLGLLKQAIESACQIITKYSGPLYLPEDQDPKENHLTFLLTSGELMVGFNGGQNINFSTHKNKCSERETCPYFSQSCESKSNSDDRINHLIFSSESLTGENIWLPLRKGELVGVDSDMHFYKEKIDVDFA